MRQIPLKINWHEGMLLSQHQFQQNDLRYSQLLATTSLLISKYNYGIIHMQHDTSVLSDGLFRLEQLEAVLPDGLYIAFDPKKHKELKPLEIDISAIDQYLSNDLTIYLAITSLSDTESSNFGKRPRYYPINEESVKDENLEDNQISIPRLFPNAFLHIGNTLPEFSTGFPLCKINKVDNVYVLKEWTPPCFYITSYIYQKCLKLAQNIREKSHNLCEKLKNSLNENTASDTEHLLNKIKPVLPGFEAFIYSKNVHPYDLYLRLSQILGELSILMPIELLPIMHPYDHNNIDDSIIRIIDCIEKYLLVLECGYLVLQFSKKEKFFYKYITQDNFNYLKNNKLYVGIKGTNNASQAELDFWMKDAIIVSDFAIDVVRSKRVQGAQRRLLSHEIVVQILPSIGSLLYEIDVDNRFIKPEQNLHIFNPGSSIQPTEINLYLPRNKS